MRKALAAIYLVAASIALASDLGGDGFGGAVLQPRANSTGLGEPGLANRELAQVDPVLIAAGEPSLDFRFADNKWLRDSVTNEQSLITFSRSAASSPGTYVASDGLIKTAAVNLQLYSEQFDQWTNSNTTDLANQVDAPDGKQTADEIEATAANGTIVRGVTTTAIDYTFSVYLKRKTGTGNIDISVDGSTWVTKSVTGDWQRFSVTQTGVAGTSNAGIRIVTSGDEVYAWGAQLEEGTVATPYIKTTSQALAAPRFDHDPVTKESLGLLVEEARSNLFLNSATLATQTVTTTAAAHTLSFYGTGTVDLTGTHTATVVGTGAYPARTTLTFTPTAGSLTATVTGTVEFAQLEAGAFPTSYIPTTTASLSRAADVAAVQDADFATTNLLAYSEAFTSWGDTNISRDSTTETAPDGQATALQVSASSANGTVIYPAAMSTSAERVFSIYLRRVTGTGDIQYTLDNGSNWTTQAITSTWQRYIFPKSTAAQRPGIRIVTSGDAIEIWGASLTATEYPVAYTTTRNLLTDSQDFERATWSKLNGATIQDDVTQAPDGTLTADKLVEANATTGHILRKTGVVNYTGYLFSVYAKAAERDWLRMDILDSESGYFDLSNGTIGTTTPNVTASISSAGNGWYRCSIFVSVTRSVFADIQVANADGADVYAGDGTSGIYVWGAQLELGSTTATDYVRTVDVVGKAYRWYEPTEGTVFVEAQNPASGTRGIVGIDDNTANERIEAQTDGTDPEWLVIDGGSGPTIDAGSVTAYTFFSLAGAYKHNDLAASVNGGAAVTDTDTIPSVNRMRIGALQASGTYLNGHIKRLTYWPTRQPDATLQVITQ